MKIISQCCGGEDRCIISVAFEVKKEICFQGLVSILAPAVDELWPLTLSSRMV